MVAVAVATLVVFLFADSLAQKRRDERFQRDAEAATRAITLEIEKAFLLLRSVTALLAASEQVSRQQFHAFVSEIQPPESIQALEWIPRTAAADRPQIEQLARQEGLTDFNITERTADGQMVAAQPRSEYFPVYYLEPSTGNEAAFGFDLASNPTRLAALLRARDTGDMVATARITLVQETSQQFGFLVFDPVYRGVAEGDDMEDRRRRLAGFALGVFRIADLVRSAIPDGEFVVRIFDRSAPADGQLLFSGSNDVTAGTASLEHTSAVAIGGRSWSIVVAPKGGTRIALETWATVLIWLSLVAVAWFSMIIVKGRRIESKLILDRGQLEEIVAQRTAELERQSGELKQSLEKEKDLRLMQRQFVAMASHEFRTPLAIIDAVAHRLERRGEEMSGPDLAARLRQIRASVKRMVMLMESTLVAEKLEAGEAMIRPVAADIRQTLQDCCQTQEDIAVTHRITLEAADMPDCIVADPAAMMQIFGNLLSNAVKYSPNAHEIDVRGWREGDDVVVAVEDHGVGIDEDDVERLFQRFFRARTATGIPGTGIGLNLARILVEEHGGSISVISKIGHGSVFTVRLPISGPDQEGTSDFNAVAA